MQTSDLLQDGELRDSHNKNRNSSSHNNSNSHNRNNKSNNKNNSHSNTSNHNTNDEPRSIDRPWCLALHMGPELREPEPAEFRPTLSQHSGKQRVRAKRSSPGNRRYWFIRTNKAGGT